MLCIGLFYSYMDKLYGYGISNTLYKLYFIASKFVEFELIFFSVSDSSHQMSQNSEVQWIKYVIRIRLGFTTQFHYKLTIILEKSFNFFLIQLHLP